MGWARLDDGWHDHPKVIEAGLEAAGLWAMCLTWANKNKRTSNTPGVVPMSAITRFAAGRAKRLTKRLHAVGLFDAETPEGWPIHDFAEYLPRYDPDQAREAGSRGGKARAARAASKRTAKQTATDSASAATSATAEEVVTGRSRAKVDPANAGPASAHQPELETVGPDGQMSWSEGFGSSEPLEKSQANQVANSSTRASARRNPVPTNTSAPTERAETSSAADEPAATKKTDRKPDETPAGIIATAVYEYADHMLKFIAVRQVAEKALRAGRTSEEITEAMFWLHDEGKPITLGLVGQYVTGRIGPASRRYGGENVRGAVDNARVLDEYERAQEELAHQQQALEGTA